MLALIVLVPDHCFDFTQYISQHWNNMSRMTQANSLKEALKVTQILTLWNAEGMPEEIPVEGLAS